MNRTKELSESALEQIGDLVLRTAERLGYEDDGQQTYSAYLYQVFDYLERQERAREEDAEAAAEARVRSYFEREVSVLITKGLTEREALQVVESRFAEAAENEDVEAFLNAFERFDQGAEIRRRVFAGGVEPHYALVLPIGMLLGGYLGMRYLNNWAGLIVGITAGFGLGLAVSLLIHASILRSADRQASPAQQPVE